MAGLCLFLHCFFLCLVLANVEKTIFISPPAELPPEDASIDNLLLTSLSELHPSARTLINASFPTDGSPRGTQIWIFLEGLRPQSRYEVRICWLATQPTSFWLYTHSVDTTFADTDLLTSLSAYSYVRHEQLSADDRQSLRLRKTDATSTDSTFLFLQIFAAADYFSLNDTLMQTVPPVAVDVILDRYVLNVFPQSLMPTGLYLLVIAVGAWFLSAWISRALLSLPPEEGGKESKKSI